MTAPFLVGASAYSRTSTMGRVPPLYMHPRDFSSIVDSPPSLFPGVGCPVLRSCPAAKRWDSSSLHMSIILLLISSVAPLCASMCSAPMNSVVSLIMLVPPRSTNLSLAFPTAGFDPSPEVVSEPPHSMPSISSDMSNSSLLQRDASCTIPCAISTALLIVLTVPPSFWMTRV